MRDKYLGGSRDALNQQAKVEKMSDEMRRIRDLAPLVLGMNLDDAESSMSSLKNVGNEAKPKTKEDFTESLKKMVRGMEDLKSMMGLLDDRDRLRRATSLRRAMSIESDDDGGRSASVGRRGLGRSGVPKGQRNSLYRKAQSLDQQIGEPADRGGKIWVSTDAGSVDSIDSSATDRHRYERVEREKSADRVSTGSQTSELEAEKKKEKTGLKKIFSKMHKSRSVEASVGDSVVDAGFKAMGVGSGKDPLEEKEGVKSKIKGMFRGKSPGPSRAQSTERDASQKTPRRTEAPVETTNSTTSLSSSGVGRLGMRASPFGPTVSKGSPFGPTIAKGSPFGPTVKKFGSLSNLRRQTSQETPV